MQNSAAKNIELLSELPGFCADCNQPVCLRQQLISLALGYCDRSFCLSCLSTEIESTPEKIIDKVIPFIERRECFAGPWKRYENAEFCPYPERCFPSKCFQTE